MSDLEFTDHEKAALLWAIEVVFGDVGDPGPALKRMVDMKCSNAAGLLLCRARGKIAMSGRRPAPPPEGEKPCGE